MNYVIESALWVVVGGVLSYNLVAEWIRRVMNDRTH